MHLRRFDAGLNGVSTIAWSHANGDHEQQQTTNAERERDLCAPLA
ncbi:MAG: hypothetical protein ACOY0T_31210 [Myxococcota bacterium]